ncbi:type II secretion system protein [Enterovibrio norvegicus]|uniref:type II secretion system protein n=1 Tax=Enterovibrio norvegicus TaxID=188144 RepID=UPI00352C32D4
MKRQGGFTLIEMIVVIVILGILAVTAAPKFIDMTDNAKSGALAGLKGAVASAANISHAQYQMNGGSGTGLTTTFHNGYPDGKTATGIATTVELGADWDVVSATSTDATSIVEFNFATNPGSECVVYTPAASEGVFPTIEVKACS